MKLLVRSLIYVHDLFGVIKCQTVRHKLVLLLVSIVIVIVYNYWWNVSMACISTVTEKTSFQYYNETEVVDAKNTEVVKLEQSQELDIGKKPKSNKIHYGGVKLNKKLHHDAVQHKDKITDGDTPQKMRYEVYQPDFTYSHPYQGTCKYHVLRKDDRDLKGYIGSYARVRCIPKRPTSGVNIKQYDSGEVLIGKGFPPTLSLQNIRCHAQEITGALYPNARSFRYTGPKIELPKGVPFNVNKTMFAIECKNTKNLTVYSNAYVNFAKEKVSRHQKRSRFTSQDQFSVNILVLDSTSRNQFYRSFYSYMYGRKSARRHCVDGEFATSRFLKIWKNFALNFKNSKHFGFTFLTALTHDDPAAVGLLDNKIKVSLEELKHSGAFENTIYIIMGDHGHRIRAIQKTYTGRIEERMPLFSIRFPDRFQKLYPEKAAKFTENSNRFVSNYDIHQTLNDILFGSYNAKSVGTSLFSDIPLTRQCNDVVIPENYCMCMEKVTVTDSDITSKLYKASLKYFDTVIPTLKCVKHYSTPKEKVLFNFYSINPLARFGIRDIRYLNKFNAQTKYKSPKDNEIYIAEGVYDITVNKRLATVTLRFKYYRKTKTVEMETNPMINIQKCKALILEDVCDCF
ncbi:unnamed protein product [Bursaphelenchus okinawaensis]|uniref:Uncharacterized protein n=1 Tax=Bursaphelenchus okinawaensis TaxID=465554 RepID=A0A811L795_9BILA|nr:unnamed protein product [Bursaphelenchus okinawaensis]CAG9119309.1 unnamed protein product [Bursaphelenchus okinawaensis]